MRMFYDFEHDEFLTENDLLKYFQFMTEEEKEEYENNIEYYIECCLAINNGCCIPLDQYESKLKKDISKISIDEYSIHDIVNKVLMLKDLYEFKSKYER